MTFQETCDFFESLKAETTKKTEIKEYDKFIYILNRLKIRELSTDETQSVETEIDRLNLKSIPENRKKYVRKALRKFEKYLKNTFSLTPKRYYTNLGLSLGSSFGVLLGIVFLSGLERSLGISFGLIIGMLAGLAIGRLLDAKAIREDRML